MANVNDAIKAAREAAANQAPAEVPSYDVVPTNAAPTSAPEVYTAPSLDSVLSPTGIANSVDNWLKVSEFGMNIGTDRQPLYTKIKARLLAVENEGFFLKNSIKTAAGEYFSTYDGTSCDRGGLFADAVNRVKRADPSQVVYPAADIILVLAEQLVGKDKPHAIGTKLGHTTARSNFQNFGQLIRDINKAGLMGQEVDVTVGFEIVSSKKNGKSWGVLTFTLGH